MEPSLTTKNPTFLSFLHQHTFRMRYTGCGEVSLAHIFDFYSYALFELNTFRVAIFAFSLLFRHLTILEIIFVH